MVRADAAAAGGSKRTYPSLLFRSRDIGIRPPQIQMNFGIGMMIDHHLQKASPWALFSGDFACELICN